MSYNLSLPTTAQRPIAVWDVYHTLQIWVFQSAAAAVHQTGPGTQAVHVCKHFMARAQSATSRKAVLRNIVTIQDLIPLTAKCLAQE